MHRLRFQFLLFLGWLFFFFNIERIQEPINIAPFIYVITALVAAITIWVPGLINISPLWLVLATIPTIIGLKLGFHRPTWGPALPITVTEICSIVLTGMLARQVTRSLKEFEAAVSNITIGHVGQESAPFSSGQAEMYREVKRAREHHRPLTTVAIKVRESTIQVAMHQMVEEVQRAMMKRYVQSGIARILAEKLHDYDIITQQDDWFILLLPETSSNEHPRLIASLRQAIAEDMGVEADIGVSTFPDEALTFESMVEQAMHKAQNVPQGQLHPPLSQQQVISQ